MHKQNCLILSLRHNVGVESDVALAQLEFKSLCGSDARIESIDSRERFDRELQNISASPDVIRLMTHGLRSEGTLAFIAFNVSVEAFKKIIYRIAFGQEAVFRSYDSHQIEIPSLLNIFRTEAVEDGFITRALTLSSVLDYSTKMVFNRKKGSSVSVCLDALCLYLLDGIEPPKGIAIEIRSAIAAKKTTLYLTHELHLYKGKFFPRMVRSLMNRYLESDATLVGDPFVGSGTALLESSILGCRSIGIDVDPTSVLISINKLTPNEIPDSVIEEACIGINDAVFQHIEGDLLSLCGRYTLENWRDFIISAPDPMRGRLIKRGKEEGYDLLGEIENDSAKVLCLIAQSPINLQPLMRVCLSHALTKKLRLRFVGIGNGRFTIDVAKVRILELFAKKLHHLVAIAEAFSWLRKNRFEFSPTSVIRGSAKEFDSFIGENKCDLIFTSPPYIPASSGREHYARARAIPLIFTGASTLEELDALDQSFIGEMSAQTDTLNLEQSMPESIRSTLEFLRTNEQRNPKYLPTLNYYVDLENVLRSTLLALKRGGRALYVVGSSHTFYVHKTKEILHTVDASRSIAQLGEKAGLIVEEIILIPLKKSGGLNARPRSTDEYSESVVVFRRD